MADLTRRALLGGAAACLATPVRPAASLPARALLEVSGAVRGGRATFDRTALDLLPQGTLATTTPWTEGVARFRGVTGRALITAVGARGRWARAYSSDGHAVDIPLDDFKNRGLLLASRKDGRLLAVREKGPLWIVYPYDELRSETYFARSVRRLNRIEIH